MALNARQQAFVREYLNCFNATKAAKLAGYSEKTAYSKGHELLKLVEIQKEIEEVQQNRFKRLDVTADRVISEIAKISFFDPRKLFHDDGIPKGISELDDDTAGAIAGLDVVSIGNSESGMGQILKYKIADKNAGLEKLCKHLGLYKADYLSQETPEPKQIIFTMQDASSKPSSE